ncbi:MAG: chemotaxis response regulator protein-glutamate methylesterase [Crocosphaera sp.]|nr:chemotaxis response regulator protein-glutamate methylesterase [Crocosphaera sp.]MDJ0685438.1 chemotaxis response regulator protein-glutamate methylesterase [Alphaproteobacteria bacterium]
MASARAIAQSSPDQGGDSRIRVMVVDDALVIRGMLSRYIDDEESMTVVASVGDGERALKSLERHDIDVVVLDIEMPRMDGLTALPKIIEASPGTQVLMASTLTLRNAKESMKAMELGAADYIPKPSSSGELRGADAFKQELLDKVRTLGRIARRKKRALGRATGAGAPAKAALATPAKQITLRPAPRIRPEVIAIGSSTGGPQALFRVLKDLGEGVRQPIIITQHMPPTFTTILAEHITKASGRPCKEAQDGDVLESGKIYVAPGDYHMLVEAGPQKRLRLNQDPPENFCRPAVDPMLRSVAEAYGKNVLVLILTGMGSDGAKGARLIADGGGMVIGQDEATSVVWGMPGAAAAAGVCSAVLPLSEIGPLVQRVATGAG